MLRNLLDKMKLPFRKERELLSKLYDVLGFYPKNVKYYRQALTHKSQRGRDKDGQRQQHNERLEYLGDAIIGAIVSDVMYHRFPQKGEGFLTNTRSKVVQRESLNRLADQLGVTKLVRVGKGATDHAHNIGGNALEALVGAIYLDRGYNACRQFIHLRIVKSLGDLNDLAMREINYKSKLIEWAQKNRFVVQFPNLPESERVDETNTFVTGVTVEGIHIAKGEGTNKKESHQRAAFTAWERIQNEGKLKDRIIDAHKKRRKQEDENNTATVPGLQRSQDDTAVRAEQRRRSKGKQQEQHANDTKVQQALEQPKPEVQQQAKPEQKQRVEQHKAEVEVQQ
ncbi:MAG: ribonuclease III, partial [Bacteroidales bacterium]|nr:ribonuclease III [Bacteroidales bacterium]